MMQKKEFREVLQVDYPTSEKIETSEAEKTTATKKKKKKKNTLPASSIVAEEKTKSDSLTRSTRLSLTIFLQPHK